MAEDVVIRAEGLGKKYIIGHRTERERYATLRDVLAKSTSGLWRMTTDLAKGRAIVSGRKSEEFWALKDVNFEVKRGEVLGIIGRNGAGKSTLLKILSRITEPTQGRVSIRGRVASLLEVGTGFHPELTGRENIYLNGAILGMTRTEIKRRFEEIVDFAEVERFLDTPVKRYSSGMYVRLAFAVAAHLEPEILVVDEVLAVGDAEFQKKCLGKMSSVASEGRTILFVSHNLEAIRRLCVTSMLVADGRVDCVGPAETSIERYLTIVAGGESSDNKIRFPANSAGRAHVVRLEVLDRNGLPLSRPRTADFVKFRLYFHSPHEIQRAAVRIYISTEGGELLSVCSTAQDKINPLNIEEGDGFVDCNFPNFPLSAGKFILGAALSIPNVAILDRNLHAGLISVEPKMGSITLPGITTAVVIDHYWHGPEPVPADHIAHVREETTL